jgi:hypothetical protein
MDAIISVDKLVVPIPQGWSVTKALQWCKWRVNRMVILLLNKATTAGSGYALASGGGGGLFDQKQQEVDLCV